MQEATLLSHLEKAVDVYEFHTGNRADGLRNEIAKLQVVRLENELRRARTYHAAAVTAVKTAQAEGLSADEMDEFKCAVSDYEEEIQELENRIAHYRAAFA